MPVYEFRCPVCHPSHNTYEIFHHGGPPDHKPVCPVHDEHLRRVFSFAKTVMFQDGYSPATGTYVSSHHDAAEQLKRKSEEAFQATGIPHDLVPVHPSDMAAMTSTEQGRDDAYRKATESGQREKKLWL